MIDLKRDQRVAKAKFQVLLNKGEALALIKGNDSSHQLDPKEIRTVEQRCNEYAVLMSKAHNLLRTMAFFVVRAGQVRCIGIVQHDGGFRQTEVDLAILTRTGSARER